MQSYEKVPEHSLFSAFRREGYPTYHDDSDGFPAIIDVWFVELCLLFVGLYVAFLVIIPGYEGSKVNVCLAQLRFVIVTYFLCSTLSDSENVHLDSSHGRTVGRLLYLRHVSSTDQSVDKPLIRLLLHFNLIRTACQFLPFWEFANQSIRLSYGTGADHSTILATIGVRIGLGGLNVTLETLSTDESHNESIDSNRLRLNEQFDWRWEQGRKGFGVQGDLFRDDHTY
jgi:hypothetical protein